MIQFPALTVPVVAPRIVSGDENPIAPEDFLTLFHALGLSEHVNPLLPSATEDVVMLPDESTTAPEFEAEVQDMVVDDVIPPLSQRVPQSMALRPAGTGAAMHPTDLMPVEEETELAQSAPAQEERLALQSGTPPEGRVEILPFPGMPRSAAQMANKLPYIRENSTSAVSDASSLVRLTAGQEPQDGLPYMTAFSEPDSHHPPPAWPTPPAAQSAFGNAFPAQPLEVPSTNFPPTQALVPTDDPDLGGLIAVTESVDQLRIEAGRLPNLPQDRVELVAKISQQIRDGVERATEIRLDPPELGRVRFIVSGGEQGLHLVIQADRPETADLLRRHLDLLGQDLRQAGYSGIDVSVGAGGQQHGRNPPSDTIAAKRDVTSVITLDHSPVPQGASGLDLRV